MRRRFQDRSAFRGDLLLQTKKKEMIHANANVGQNRGAGFRNWAGRIPDCGDVAATRRFRDCWTGADDGESIALIHHAEELGINLIDTAEGLWIGHSEILTGKALQGRRDKWVIATKVQPNLGIDADPHDEKAVLSTHR